MTEATVRDIVGVGEALDATTVVGNYRAGNFPMHAEGELLWWSPVKRGVLHPEDFIASRSLRRSRNHFTASVDEAFEQVVEGCGDPARPHGWINDEIRSVYGELHSRGIAHSVEVWDGDGQLVGGLYGLGIGGLFAAESKFHRATDASKVALWHLVAVLLDAGADRLIDVQWLTPHLASLGCREISRRHYLAGLPGLVDMPEVDWKAWAGRGRTKPAPGR